MSQMNLLCNLSSVVITPYHSAEEKKLTRIPQVMGKSPALNLSVLGR
uniref:Transcriptional regulator n=1 Tax=Heterorhabditis bacteriophora TaxID=37862 RepID=A0A1I7WKQ2_HETBA